MTYREELELVGRILGKDLAARGCEARWLDDELLYGGITSVNRSMNWMKAPEGFEFWYAVDQALIECGWPDEIDERKLHDRLREVELMGV